MPKSVRILVVDDFAPFRSLVCSAVGRQPGLRVIGQAADGLGAVEMAKDLRPDLVLLDIGLPKISGIEAARRIRESVPGTKIVFLSQHHSWSIVEEGLRSGALGYVVKLDIESELMPAVEAVLEGRHYVSSSFAGHDVAALTGARIAAHHEAGFYTDDQRLLDDVTQFLATTLNAGNAAVVLATEAHRMSFLQGLKELGIDIDAATRQGRYAALDVAEALSMFMVDGLPDRERFRHATHSIISAAAKAACGPRPHVGMFGECVQLLCEQGNAEAAIQMEKLGNELVDDFDVDILCAYSLDRLRGLMDGQGYQRIRAEHSTVHFH